MDCCKECPNDKCILCKGDINYPELTQEKDKIIKEKKELENQINNDQERVLEMQKQMQEIKEEKSNTDRI